MRESKMRTLAKIFSKKNLENSKTILEKCCARKMASKSSYVIVNGNNIFCRWLMCACLRSGAPATSLLSNQPYREKLNRV